MQMIIPVFSSLSMFLYLTGFNNTQKAFFLNYFYLESPVISRAGKLPLCLHLNAVQLKNDITWLILMCLCAATA